MWVAFGRILRALLGFSGHDWTQPTAQDPLIASCDCWLLPQHCSAWPAVDTDEPGPTSVPPPSLVSGGGAQFPGLGLFPGWLCYPGRASHYWLPAHREQPTFGDTLILFFLFLFLLLTFLSAINFSLSTYYSMLMKLHIFIGHFLLAKTLAIKPLQ